MQVDLKIRRHPGKQALLAYAENLVDNHAAIDRALAAHISQCPACHAEVKAMQASLSFAASAPALEPSSDMTAQILLSGRQARTELKKQATPLRTIWKIAQGGACAAAMVVVTALMFNAFLSTAESSPSTPAFTTAVPPQITASMVSPEMLRETADVAAEGQALSAAIQSKHGDRPTPQELEQQRVVQARGDDIAAAVTALERNPHNVRATHVVHANLKSLRNMYVEGGSL